MRYRSVVSARFALPALLLALICGSPAVMAYEQPEYQVLSHGDDYEIRQYAAYIVAETQVDGNLRRSGNAAFRRLAGYIFGKNDADQKMSMTAPVETRRADNEAAMMLAQPDGDEQFRYAFVMERAFDMETLPTPRDPRVTLREVPARVVAVRSFSGRWSDGNYEKNESALMSALARDGHTAAGAPMLARYNGPMTPWFLRRNEVMVDIVPADADAPSATAAVD